uniref:Uncharacterized protein n=1 Tax=Romanomermis culicivorax TaxID=13658 RepID=A0A915JKG0_ROMCU
MTRWGSHFFLPKTPIWTEKETVMRTKIQGNLLPNRKEKNFNFYALHFVTIDLAFALSSVFFIPIYIDRIYEKFSNNTTTSNFSLLKIKDILLVK